MICAFSFSDCNPILDEHIEVKTRIVVLLVDAYIDYVKEQLLLTKMSLDMLLFLLYPNWMSRCH